MYKLINGKHRLDRYNHYSNINCNTFGKGKISSIMGDLAKGIKSFKKGLSDDNSGNDSSNNNSDNSNSENK